MRNQSDPESPPFCPSAPPDVAGSIVIGVVGGTAEQPRVSYLAEPQPVTDAVLALADPVEPIEVFRFAAPCAQGACQYFDGSRCRLATRVVELLPATVQLMPPCRLRPSCRWWRQEGAAACLRCPQIVTKHHRPSDAVRRAAAAARE